jgi:hypothetical protein
MLSSFSFLSPLKGLGGVINRSEEREKNTSTLQIKKDQREGRLC